MASKIKGFDDLDRKLESLGDVGKRIGKKAVREGMKPIVKQMRKDAPKDSGDGAKKLKVTTVKTYKTGTAVARAGINASNWEQTKHLYFQNFTYENHINGKIVEVHAGWMFDSFERSKEKGGKIMRDYAQQEINKIIK